MSLARANVEDIDVYDNLAVCLKLHLDLVASGKPGIKDSWDQVLAFYDQMAIYSNFDLVDEHQFKKVTSKVAREKPVSGKAHLKADEDPCFLVTSLPPAPVVAEPNLEVGDAADG